MSLKTETHAAQSKLAKYCRSGNYEQIPDVKFERAQVYRRLVHNAMNSSLTNAYPITHSILKGKRWEQLVNDFLSKHAPQSPFLWSMPKELWEYVVADKYTDKLGMPFLDELLYFEWLEIEVYMMKDTAPPPYQEDGDILEDPIIFNPDNKVQSFHYPVFSKGHKELEKSRSEYYLLIHRHPETLAANFIELSPFYFLVVEILKQQGITGQQALTLAAEYLQIKDKKTLCHAGKCFLEMLKEKKAILGFSRTKEYVT